MARIAVVDDSPGARLFASACLKHLGHEVVEITPTCLFEVLDVLHAQPPDLLISDLIMPGCSGRLLIEVCREDRHLKGMKILLLTAHGDEKLAHFLQTLNSVHYLTKPISPPELSECVTRFLGGDLEIDPGWALACKGVVAVVDDSQMSRVFHASCLRKHGFRAVDIEPTDMKTVLAALADLKPDLLMLDYLMPRFRGDSLIRALRATPALADLPVLLVTAHHGREVDDLLKRIDRVEALYKPIFPDEIGARIQALLDPADRP